MSDVSEILSLVHDLESWNSTAVRTEAAKKLARVGRASKIAFDALSRVAKESYTDLGRVAAEAIEQIHLSGQMTKPTTKPRTMLTSVEVTSEPGDGLEIESTKAFCKCNFCGKETVITPSMRRFTEKLSGPERFFCSFCLRHKLNHRDSRHTLLMSFRGIIGYYYYAFYASSKQVNMSISEITDYVNLHVQAGMQNPIFIYDPETFVWFVDFTRVGKSKRKLPIEDVLATVGEILLTFDLYENIPGIRPHKMYLKYEEAILKFYHQRHRPVGARLLIPTLVKTGAGDYAPDRLAKDAASATIAATTVNEKRRIDPESTRMFMPSVLKDAMGKKY